MGFQRRTRLLRVGFVFIVCVTIFQMAYLYSMMQDIEVADGPLSSAMEAFIKSSNNKESAGKYERRSIPVFYNLFVANASDAPRVMEIVSEQKSFLLPEYHKPFFVQSMGGSQLKIPDATILGHRANGTELITLHSLWDFCRKKPETEKVVYLHSKGSYTNSEQNRIFRRFLTAGALSEECALAEDCNVCSSRFSPLPHPHAPGNMWLARCDYVRELIDPFQFEKDMSSIVSTCSKTYKWFDGGPWCDGRDRWSAEHWVHSHPSVKVRCHFVLEDCIEFF